MSGLVNVAREDIRPCDKCKGPFPFGIVGIIEVKSLVLDEQSVRTVAGMETHFGPGHEKLASLMSPSIKATENNLGRKVLCFPCLVGVMEAAAIEPKGKEEAEEEL